VFRLIRKPKKNFKLLLKHFEPQHTDDCGVNRDDDDDDDDNDDRERYNLSYF